MTGAISCRAGRPILLSLALVALGSNTAPVDEDAAAGRAGRGLTFSQGVDAQNAYRRGP